MSDLNVKVLVLRGLISQMTEDEQKQVFDAEKKLRAVVAEAGDFGVTALTLVGAEMVGEA